MNQRFFRPVLIGCAFLLALGSGCSGKPKKPGEKTPEVEYVLPVEENVTDYEFFTGRTAAENYVDVRARVTGYLTEIKFNPGAEVKKDKVLFKIDPRPYQATLDQATGQVNLAKARLKLAVADLARAKELAKTPGAISQQDLDKYAAAQEEAAASVAANEAARESADLNVKFTDVTSPVDGVVSRSLLTLGNLINADTTLLTTIVSEDPMWAYFDIDERTMLRLQDLIRKGEIKSARQGEKKFPVELGLSNEQDRYPYAGVMDFVNTQVDASTGTLQVRGIFDNPKQGKDRNLSRILMPGLFVRVRLPIGKAHKALVVPQKAIIRQQGSTLLLVVDEKNIVEARPVILGAEVPGGKQVVNPVQIIRDPDGFRRALDGEKSEPSLTLKDRVIVGGLQRIRPGMPVEAKAEAAKRK